MAVKRWSDAEVMWLEWAYPRTANAEIGQDLGRSPKSIGLKARQIGLRKDPDFAEDQKRANQFRAGQKAWNSGEKGLHTGGKSTQFKAGHVPHTWLPIGSEVVDPKDGYLKRKVRDGSVPATYNWEFAHRLEYEKHHGPIPDGHVVCFRDGNRQNVDPSNLEAISRADLARRNTIWNRYPDH